jgi:5'-nucleotidase
MRIPFRRRSCSTSTCPTCLRAICKASEVTRLGKRHKAEPVVRSDHAARRDRVLGRCGRRWPPMREGTDFHAVANGFVSITPLQIDLTHTGQIAPVFDWLQR